MKRFINEAWGFVKFITLPVCLTVAAISLFMVGYESARASIETAVCPVGMGE